MEIFKSLNRLNERKSRIFLKNFSTKLNSLNYCFNNVKKYDFENFLCILLLPENIKSKAIGLRAFNIELAKVQDNVTDPLIGEMRLQFWKNTIEGLYNGIIPEHPVAVQLYKILEENNNLSKQYFSRLISSRLDFLKKPYFNSLEEMEKYSENSVSSIYYLLLELSGIQDLQSDHAASHLGKAIGIANLLRSQPYLSSSKQKIITFPQDILSKYGISQEKVLRGNMHPELLDKAAYDIASRSWIHLEKARNIKVKHQEIKKIFLPAVPTELYLERLRRAEFNIYNSQLGRRDGLLPLKLYWRKIKGSF